MVDGFGSVGVWWRWTLVVMGAMSLLVLWRWMLVVMFLLVLAEVGVGGDGLDGVVGGG